MASSLSPLASSSPAAPAPFMSLLSQQIRTLMQPRKTAYRKHFKGRVHGIASRGNTVAFGSFGLQTLTPTRLTAKQIEAARVVIVRGVRKVGKMWMRVFPDISASAKPAEVRMGKGKGMVDHYYARVKAERVIFEVDGIPKEVAQALFKVAGSKLPIRTRLIEKSDVPKPPKPTYPTKKLPVAAAASNPKAAAPVKTA